MSKKIYKIFIFCICLLLFTPINTYALTPMTVDDMQIKVIYDNTEISNEELYIPIEITNNLSCTITIWGTNLSTLDGDLLQSKIGSSKTDYNYCDISAGETKTLYLIIQNKNVTKFKGTLKATRSDELTKFYVNLGEISLDVISDENIEENTEELLDSDEYVETQVILTEDYTNGKQMVEYLCSQLNTDIITLSKAYNVAEYDLYTLFNNYTSTNEIDNYIKSMCDLYSNNSEEIIDIEKESVEESTEVQNTQQENINTINENTQVNETKQYVLLCIICIFIILLFIFIIKNKKSKKNKQKSIQQSKNIQNMSIPQQPTNIPNRNTSMPLQPTNIPNRNTNIPQQHTNIPNKNIENEDIFEGFQ